MKIPFTKYWVLLRKYLAPYKANIVILFTFLVLSTSFQLINPQIIKYYIDTFGLLDNGLISLNKTKSILFEAAIFYMLIAIFQQLLYVSSVYISVRLSWNATNKLRSDLASHCLNLDMSFHNKYSSGKMVERIDGDITTLSNFFSQFSIMLVANTILIFGVLTAFFIEDIRIGLVFAFFTTISMLLLYKIWNIASPYWKEVRQRSADLMGFIEEGLSGKEDIRAMGGQEYILKRFHHISKKEYDTGIRAIIVSRLVHITIMGFIAFGSTLVYVVGIPLFKQEIISFGTIFLLIFYTELLFRPIIQITRQLQDLSQADASMDRIDEFFRVTTKIKDLGTEKFHPEVATSIKFEDISFDYITEKSVLRNISFTIEPGKSLGLIGKTGCGKTTISRMLFRLYDPKEGRISINNINHQEYTLNSLRKNIAYVTQKVELFQASLRDNITFFDNTIPDEKILEVIGYLELDEWFKRLPKGLDTKLQSDESGLSAGEAQLLALTRVFLKEPSVVVLDEASSRLDPLTERLISRAVKNLLKGRTSIIIAHRLETLETVDEILLLDDGQVAEYGKREELIRDPNSQFAKLLKLGIKEVLA
ncbi:MAG: ABC transporter ATP-binding protein [Candidatus Heimdallarchaeota archaeon]|nr:ABC transporter ATP-binding protein [Candidatus Heimdallarchaeota archaeon]